MRILPSQTAEWVTRPGPTLSQVIWFLPECCTFVTLGRALTCNLMVMLETRDNENEGSEGGQYACTEEDSIRRQLLFWRSARSKPEVLARKCRSLPPRLRQRPRNARAAPDPGEICNKPRRWASVVLN